LAVHGDWIFCAAARPRTVIFWHIGYKHKRIISGVDNNLILGTVVFLTLFSPLLPYGLPHAPLFYVKQIIGIFNGPEPQVWRSATTGFFVRRFGHVQYFRHLLQKFNV
jgi:hypothetical protein